MKQDDPKQKLTTTTLFSLLEKSQSLETFLIDHEIDLPAPNVADY